MEFIVVTTSKVLTPCAPVKESDIIRGFLQNSLRCNGRTAAATYNRIVIWGMKIAKSSRHLGGPFALFPIRYSRFKPFDDISVFSRMPAGIARQGRRHPNGFQLPSFDSGVGIPGVRKYGRRSGG